ncbi:MAG: hypothetical protein ACE5J5_00395 [Candidatus Hydrothermarchaeales archaeon]
MRIKYKIDDMIKVIVFHDYKHLQKIGLDRQKMKQIENALKKGKWRIV